MAGQNNELWSHWKDEDAGRWAAYTSISVFKNRIKLLTGLMFTHLTLWAEHNRSLTTEVAQKIIGAQKSSCQLSRMSSVQTQTLLVFCAAKNLNWQHCTLSDCTHGEIFLSTTNSKHETVIVLFPFYLERCRFECDTISSWEFQLLM